MQLIVRESKIYKTMYDLTADVRRQTQTMRITICQDVSYGFCVNRCGSAGNCLIKDLTAATLSALRNSVLPNRETAIGQKLPAQQVCLWEKYPSGFASPDTK